MKHISNNLGLPNEIHRAAIHIFGQYDRGESDISATQLGDPPRKTVLEVLHEDELVEDVSDLTFAFMGAALHQVLRDAFVQEHGSMIAAPDFWVEQRLFAKMQGWTVSGAPDHYERGHVRDYKSTSVYSMRNGKPKQDWCEQLNVYAWLLRENGLQANTAEVSLWLRDWSKMDAKKDRSYPQYNTTTVPVPLWTPEEAETWVMQRVMAHQAAMHDLPFCTPEEQWARPGKWAVVKRGIKRAVRLHDTHAEAAKHVQQLGGDHFVENRPGMAVRCQAYCSAAPFCTQYHTQKED